MTDAAARASVFGYLLFTIAYPKPDIEALTRSFIHFGQAVRFRWHDVRRNKSKFERSKALRLRHPFFRISAHRRSVEINEKLEHDVPFLEGVTRSDAAAALCEMIEAALVDRF